MNASRFLAGAPVPEGRGRAPSLRGGDFSHWTNADIVEALTSGFTPEGDVLGSSMGPVAQHRGIAEKRSRSRRHLSQEPSAAWPPRDGQAVAQHRVVGGPTLVPVEPFGFSWFEPASGQRPRLTGLNSLGFRGDTGDAHNARNIGRR